MIDAFDRIQFTNRMGLRPGIPRIRDVQIEVCERYAVTLEQLVGKSQNRRIVYPRHEAMFEARIRTGASLPKIGREFNRHHSVVLHGITEHARRLKKAANGAS